MFLWSVALKPRRCLARFASLSDPVSTGGNVHLQFVTAYVIMKGCEKKKVVKGGLYEKYYMTGLRLDIQVTLVCSEANTGVNLRLSSGVEIRRRRRKKNKDVERELSSELPLWKHTHQKAPETLLFSFLLCLGQGLVEFLSDEVRLRGLVSLFPTFFTDYMSVLGSNCGVDVHL